MFLGPLLASCIPNALTHMFVGYSLGLMDSDCDFSLGSSFAGCSPGFMVAAALFTLCLLTVPYMSDISLLYWHSSWLLLSSPCVFWQILWLMLLDALFAPVNLLVVLFTPVNLLTTVLSWQLLNAFATSLAISCSLHAPLFYCWLLSCLCYFTVHVDLFTFVSLLAALFAHVRLLAALFCVLCWVKHRNLMKRFRVQALQDPPLCSSTDFSPTSFCVTCLLLALLNWWFIGCFSSYNCLLRKPNRASDS